ncbi:11522_t:CDS:2 [Scutellospora calospora]|uniref:11522_t:CDS:1 n=1 Tax=Scutellospora calospora TaxID=85575 RepID=A0ACA9N454_9GLOM|nr:11522_t:CDS:2 [Scutellospora calospora]
MLFKRTKSRVVAECFVGQFTAWREKTTSYITPSIPGRLFPNIYSILQKYVMPKILEIHIEQMDEAVMYYDKKVDFKDLENLILETVKNGPVELEYDFCQICLNELLKEIDHSLVIEVWEVRSIEHKSNVRQHVALLKNGYHLCTCILLFNSGVYKDEMIDLLVINEPFVRGKSYEDEHLIQYILLFPDGTLLGLTRKCVELVNYDDLNDSNLLMKIFKEWIHTHKEIQYNDERSRSNTIIRYG